MMVISVFAAGLVAMVLYAFLLFEFRLARSRQRRAEIRRDAEELAEQVRADHRAFLASLGERRRAGFTLVEVLTATVLALLMLTTVVAVFANVLDSMKDSRSMIEVNDRLRYTKDRLAMDLAGVTVPMLPPRRPESGEGYFEYIEGPVGLIVPPQTVAPYDIDGDGTLDPDSTVGDTDDILMFTTRTAGEPFVGMAQTVTGTAQSQVAEVCWFLRGTTLYRRQLLVAPGLEATLPVGWDTAAGFYARNDISARQEGGTHDWRTGGTVPATLRLNTLGDLTKRENRYGHQPWAYPHDARFWGVLGLPALRECSDADWPFPLTEGADDDDSPLYGAATKYIYPTTGGTMFTWIELADGTGNPQPRAIEITGGPFDAWESPNPWNEVDRVTGTLSDYMNGSRIADDVILTNVLSFDVKAWDPGAPIFQDTSGTGTIEPSGNYPEQNWYRFEDGAATVRRFFTQADPTTLVAPHAPIAFGAYVDLNYLGVLRTAIAYPQAPLIAAGLPQSDFFGHGQNFALRGPHAAATTPMPYAPAVYDTWSTHYEHDGFDQDGDGATDEGANGFDDDGIGGVDDATERESPPPYPVPLRGIQVKLRIFEPATRQIREVTVVQDFVGQ